MSPDTPVDEPLVRSEGLWFKDGTIVLQAENVLFRVYPGLLSKHSPFFEQLFSLPQPTDAEQYDGCPIVRLAGDSAEDMRNFLLVMHEIRFPSALACDATSLAAVLALGTKYEVVELRRTIIEMFAPVCPTTLLAYRELIGKLHDPAFRKRLPLGAIPTLIAVANSLSIAAPVLLPFTLLRLLRISKGETSFIFEGVTHNNKRIYLTPQLQDALIKGKTNLSRLARQFVYPTIFTEPCANKNLACETERAGLLAGLYRTDGYLEPLCQRDSIFTPFCASCKQKFQSDLKGKETVWRELPKAFGLPSWQVLEDTTLMTCA